MLPNESDKKFSIPPKLAAIYEDFECITETGTYLVFEARTRNSHEKHSIRILDPTKDLVKKNFDSAATLFIQELFHLHSRCPGSVLINTLEISEDRKQIACAVSQYILVTPQLQKIGGSMDLKNPNVIEKPVERCDFRRRIPLERSQNEKHCKYHGTRKYLLFKGERTFFLGNWDKITEENTARLQDLTFTVIDTVESELRSQDVATEIKALAFILLKMKKLDIEELEELHSMKKIKTLTYNSAVKSAVEEAFNDSQKLQNLAERMLSLDPKNLPNLEELKIKEDKIQVPFKKAKNESNTAIKEVGNQVALEESKINLRSNSIIVNSPMISTPPALLAWCSRENNKISVIDLKTKQNYVTFDGASISDTDYNRTHVKEIPNAKLLVSLHHSEEESAHMVIFDISKKGKANKIYSLGEVSGSKLG